MHSSNSLPSLPGDSALSVAGAWVLVVAIALVPLLWLPVFHSGFETPRQALVLVVVTPVAALLVARNWAQRTFARVPVLLILAIVAAGLLALARVGFDLHAAWRSLRFLGPMAGCVLAGAALMHPRFLDRLHLALVVPAIPVLAIGLLRRYAGIPGFLPDRPDVAISSTLGNSNALGEAFAPVFLAGLVLAPAAQSTLRRALLWAGAACALALVVVSKSRGAQLATAAGLAVHGALWIWSRRRERDVVLRAVAAILLVVILAGVFLALPMGRGAADHLRSFWSTTAPTNAVRLSIWGGTCELVRETLPLGAGLGRFEPAFLPHRKAAEWHLSGVDTRVDNPHQEFLWIASETGVLGGLALLLLLGTAFARATRPDDDLTSVMRAPQRALLLATVALVVLALVRAPLHHPAGILVFATLLGSVAPRRVQPRAKLPDVAVAPVLGALLVLSALDLNEDRKLGIAVGALNDVKSGLRSGRLDRVPEDLATAGAGFKDVPSAMLKDFDRSFRAALGAGELADLKDSIREHVPPDASADLPDQADVLALLEEVLSLCPNHPGATNQLALVWLKQGAVARAVKTWKDAIAALPQAPRFRHNLALLYQRNDEIPEALALMRDEVGLKQKPSEDDRIALASLALGLGRDAETFGRWLAPPRPAGASRAGSPLPSSGPPGERRRAILSWLADHPFDARALADLAAADYEITNGGGGSPELFSEANRAYSRSRVAFAAEALEQGDLEQAEKYLKFAVQKDGGFLDAHFLRAKVAARAGRSELVGSSLRAIRSRAGVQDLRAWIEKDPDLAAWLRDGRLAEIGL
jgi:O-antigen ligase/tetratricopeptide (TPR) repeat protein